jgi:hypothetical protein
MRSAAIVAAIVLALPAVAQEEQPPPDYSRQALLRFVSEIPERPKRERNVKYHFGAVEFRALGMDWRVVYLPILLPLSGTGPRKRFPIRSTSPALRSPPLPAHGRPSAS